MFARHDGVDHHKLWHDAVDLLAASKEAHQKELANPQPDSQNIQNNHETGRDDNTNNQNMNERENTARIDDNERTQQRTRPAQCAQPGEG